MTQWVHTDARFVSWEATADIHAIFTTRQGGVSASPFNTLNVSFNVMDLPTDVTQNRCRVMEMMGRNIAQLVMAEQVHQNKVGWASDIDASKGALTSADALSGLDGLLTRHSDIVLGMGFADCVPIFLAVPSHNIVGLLHAGWRGTVKGVQLAAVEQLKKQGIDPREIEIGIGPSIGPCCYEVDGKVANQFFQVMGNKAPLTPHGEGHYFLDLWEANRRQLVLAGVPETHIDISHLCTACHEDQFFSYRRDQGKCGRMGGFICMNR